MLAALAGRLGLSTLVSREQEPSAGQTVNSGPLLPANKPYMIDNLSTPQLQKLAAFAGATTLPVSKRSTLLNVVNTHLEVLSSKQWRVETAEVCTKSMSIRLTVATPQSPSKLASAVCFLQNVSANRSLGTLVSLAGDFWIYGGMSSDRDHTNPLSACYTGSACHIMTLSKHTGQWEPVSPPEGVSKGWFWLSAGELWQAACCSLAMVIRSNALL